jgi:hypothetical protein
MSWLCAWVVGWVGCINMINRTTESGNLQLSDKVMYLALSVMYGWSLIRQSKFSSVQYLIRSCCPVLYLRCMLAAHTSTPSIPSLCFEFIRNSVSVNIDCNHFQVLWCCVVPLIIVFFGIIAMFYPTLAFITGTSDWLGTSSVIESYPGEMFWFVSVSCEENCEAKNCR